MMEERKKKILGFMREEAYKPLLFEELALVLDVPASDMEQFRSILEQFEHEGSIFRTRKERYGVPERMGLVAGKIQGNERGYGFLIPDDDRADDVFVSNERMNGAMHNDRVVVRITRTVNQGRKAEGEVIKIIERSNHTIVGTFEKSDNFGFATPDHQRISGDIFIPREKDMGAHTGQKVVVKILKWPEKGRNAEGQIIEILGEANQAGVDILSIIRTYNIPYDFKPEIIEEVKSIPQSVTDEDIKSRRDLRKLPMVTIDGEDAKDLDDAISIEIIDNGNFRLGVHIADVSHYVREGSNLDAEALNRGTSVYLVDRVIPMLPRELSNGICSLNAGVDRLAFTVMMNIDPRGNVTDHEIFESVIHINERMTYTDVYKMLELDDKDLKARYAGLLDEFSRMKELALILRKKRFLRGAIDFDFDEAKIIVDENGKPVEVKRYEITLANKIIEEFMLLCNETVSEHFFWTNVPFVYRIHEEPDPEKIETLNNFIYNFGYHIKGVKNLHPRALQDVLEKVKGTRHERIISTVMLRSLQKARYSHQHEGHFGLAAVYYSHFTSPIRRYPDLIIHRIMKEYLSGKMSLQREEYYREQLPDITKICSDRERGAQDAERDCEDLKKAEYMMERIGHIYKGIISNITSFGMFIQLENTIEGLIRLSSLEDDYYYYDDRQFCLIGERTGKVYRIGDEINIEVSRSDPQTRQIDFSIHKEDKGEDNPNPDLQLKMKKDRKKKADMCVSSHVKGLQKKRKRRKRKN